LTDFVFIHSQRKTFGLWQQKPGTKKLRSETVGEKLEKATKQGRGKYEYSMKL